jgi:predicted NUDIX family NTP pyrophosphohydrolase
MPKPTSAGILLYRFRDGRLEVLLAHPGGPFWARRDAGAWTIPKGEVAQGEEPLSAARREFEEETGYRPPGPFVALTPVRQRSGKRVQAWASPGDFDPRRLRSSTFEMEWPPRSGRRRRFPEVDRVAWLGVHDARRLVVRAQAELIERLADALGAPLAPV